MDECVGYIAGLVVAVIVVLILVILLCWDCKWRTSAERRPLDDENPLLLDQDRDEHGDLNYRSQHQSDLRTWNEGWIRRLEEMEEEKRETQERLESSQELTRSLDQELHREKREKDDVLKRLSALMSNRLRDGNPNVVDLSDQNRPLKVGEQFSELYDNQWTDAFSLVQNHFGDKKTERDVIGILLKIVEECFELCKQAAETEMSQLQTDVRSICARLSTEESNLAEDLLQRIKEERKLNAVNRVPDLSKVIPHLKEKIAIPECAICFDSEIIANYVQECLKLCYLMVNQDPPMVIQPRPNPLNVENFKAYQTRGTTLVYIVWPILFLYEGGPLVSKGVAEFGQ